MFFYLLLILIILETAHRLNKRSILKMNIANWNVDKNGSSIKLTGIISLNNINNSKEIMVPELALDVKLLGNKNFNSLKRNIFLKPLNEDIKDRKDNYWQAYIVKSMHSLNINVSICIEETDELNILEEIQNIWIDFNWVNYSPFGRSKIKEGFVIPLIYPKKIERVSETFKKNKPFITIPIRTHMLGVLDDPIKVIKEYVSPILKPGDIITFGETPLAIIQGRYHHPGNIRITFLAKFLCYFFHPTSSLATACGMQSLLNEVGPIKIIFAWLIGSFFKIIKVKGVFYRLAGKEARLIDDITGTTPPYDQLIVLGPKKPQEFCEKLALEIGADVAVVDVNDLGKVKILASSKSTDKFFLSKALMNNPAGNADEQTPIVIVRPS